MKVIIAGSRDFTCDRILVNLDWLFSSFHDLPDTVTEVVSGGARGADQLGEQWAERHGIPIKRFIPDWTIGAYAGHLRNREMAEYGDMLVALWDGESRGTKNMIDEAFKHKLETHVFIKTLKK